MTHRLPVPATLLCAALLTPAAQAGDTPSFDCGKASHEVERIVCRDADLAALDRQMAQAYRIAEKNYPASERAKLKAEQRAWIRERNQCDQADDPVACTNFAYRSRASYLQITSGDLVVPEPVNYLCDGGPYDYLTAIFYNQTLLPAVVLTRVGGPETEWQVTAYRQRSGSGAKYANGDTLFWEHQGEAMLETGGKTYRCKLQEQKGEHPGGV